jgi:hypothetical protein
VISWPTTVISWWLRFLRNALIVLVSTYAIYTAGLFVGLGLLIVLLALPEVARTFLGRYLFDAAFPVSLVMFLLGKYLYSSHRILVHLSGCAFITLGAALFGAGIGLEVQNFTVQHAVEDLGLYDGPGQAAVVASAILVHRSSRSWISRVGSMMIVLASALVIGFVCESIQYSHVVASLHLTKEQMLLLHGSALALMLVGAVATAALLIRRSYQPAMSAGPTA